MKRLIFTLYYSEDSFCMSRNFKLQKVGDVDWLKKNYNFAEQANSIDELVILDVSRSHTDKSRSSFFSAVESLTEDIFLPLSLGGKITSLDDAHRLFEIGSDKIICNSIWYKNPSVIDSIASIYGSQAVTLSLDLRKVDSEYILFSQLGHKSEFPISKLSSMRGQLSSVGEIYITSIDNDGTGFGYDMELLRQIISIFPNKTIIASGGAGKGEHFFEAFDANPKLSACSTGNLFNFLGKSLGKARTYLTDRIEDLPYLP